MHLTASPQMHGAHPYAPDQFPTPSAGVLAAQTVPQSFRAQVLDTPAAIAVTNSKQACTYAALDERSNQLATFLRAHAVGAEVPVGICLRRSPEFVVAALAVMKAGAAYVPLDPDYPIARLTFMLEDSRAPLVLTRGCLAPRLKAVSSSVIDLDSVQAEVDCYPTHATQPDIEPQSLAYIIYTSGSTGQPKGVQITHASLMNLVEWHRAAFAVLPNDRASQVASIGFDAAVWELWPNLCAGASIYIVDDETRNSPQDLCRWIADAGITISFVPTPVAERMLSLEWPVGGSLRLLLTGGDVLRHAPPDGLPFTVVNNYGPTECTVVATSGVVSPSFGQDSRPHIGRAILNTQTFVLDGDLRQVPEGEAGELYIGGAGLARGYLNRPDLTEAKFIQFTTIDAPGTRLYRTGDLVRVLSTGELAFIGRVDDQVKIRGFRIEPNEVVSVLDSCQGIADSFVLAADGPDGEKRLIAYVIVNGELSASAVREHARHRLPEHMVPSTFVRLDSFPLGPNGKIDRSALPVPMASNTLRGEMSLPPNSVVEQSVSDILRSLLQLEQIGRDDNFFLMGGHSLLGAQVIARIRDEFDVELPLRKLFDGPTVAELSNEIEQLIVAKLEAMSPDEMQRAIGSTKAA